MQEKSPVQIGYNRSQKAQLKDHLRLNQREGDSTPVAEPEVFPLEQRPHAEPTGQHNMFTHFPKDATCDVLQDDQNLPCQMSKKTK